MLKMNERRASGDAVRDTSDSSETTALARPAALGLILLMAGAAVPFECLAQNGGQAPSGMAALQSDNTRIALAFESGKMKSHLKMVGLGGGKTYVELLGRQATVQLNQGQAKVFLMSISDSGAGVTYDSASKGLGSRWATLFKLDVDRTNREVVQSNITGYGPIHKTKTQDSYTIPLNFSRYDDHTVRIEPRVPLPAGEYAFSAPLAGGDPNQLNYYCFGVN